MTPLVSLDQLPTHKRARSCQAWCVRRRAASPARWSTAARAQPQWASRQGQQERLAGEKQVIRRLTAAMRSNALCWLPLRAQHVEVHAWCAWAGQQARFVKLQTASRRCNQCLLWAAAGLMLHLIVMCIVPYLSCARRAGLSSPCQMFQHGGASDPLELHMRRRRQVQLHGQCYAFEISHECYHDRSAAYRQAQGGPLPAVVAVAAASTSTRMTRQGSRSRR